MTNTLSINIDTNQMVRDLKDMNDATVRYMFVSMAHIEGRIKLAETHPQLVKIDGKWFAISRSSIDGQIPDELKDYNDTKLISVLKLDRMVSPSIQDTKHYMRGFDPEPMPMTPDYVEVLSDALENSKNCEALDLKSIKPKIENIGLRTEYLPTSNKPQKDIWDTIGKTAESVDTTYERDR